jgi:hypothetical protein
MLLTFALIYNLAVTALDVKDAFLMVPQMEILYVKIPMWIRRWTGSPYTHWLLKRCLPWFQSTVGKTLTMKMDGPLHLEVEVS